MLKKSFRKSSLFLIELILAIFLFCICSAICVWLFITARTISKDSENLTMAVNQTTNLVELFRHGENFFENVSTQYPNACILSNQIILYYDKNWTDCTKANAYYDLTVTLKQNGAFHQAIFTVMNTQDKAKLYSLNSECYIKEYTP